MAGWRIRLCGALGAMILAAAAPAQQAMDESTYRRLEQAHGLLAEERYGEAMDKLQSMESMRLNDYEQALVYQTYGFVHAQQSQYEQAVDFFERCLALDALPPEGQQGMLYSLAGLYASLGRYEQTIAAMERWLAGEAEPAADACITLAVAHAELGRHDQALSWVDRAIARAEAPQRSWYELRVSELFEVDDYRRAAETLEAMVAIWPGRKSYWQMLSGAWQELGDDVRAASVMQLAYHKGVLSTEKELLDVVRMQLYVDDPYAAGRLLESELAAGRVARSEASLELLLAAWTRAREFDRSVAVIAQLAELTGEGSYHLTEAQLYAEKAEWERVVTAAELSLASGSLDEPGAAWLLKGMAQAELGRLRPAQRSLREARRLGDEETRRQAAGWLALVRDSIAIAERVTPGADPAAGGT